jgi:hypothetical protein
MNKTDQQKLEQVIRIMRKLEKRGQNKESINDKYFKLWKITTTNKRANC